MLSVTLRESTADFMCNVYVSICFLIPLIPGAVKLSCLQSAHCTLSLGEILTSKVGQTDLVLGL